MPLIGNVLNRCNLGPLNVIGYNDYLSFFTNVLISASWKILTLVGAIGSTILVLYLFSAFKILSKRQEGEGDNKKWLLILTISTALLYLLAIAGLEKQYWFDRYLIFLFPLLMMIVSVLSLKTCPNKFNSRVAAISMVMLLLCGGFTISVTHDYLTWNRVRWQALNHLMQSSQISPDIIDGGSEFNGWYFGNRLETCNPRYQKSSDKISAKWEDFTCLWGSWGIDSSKYRYMVSFIPATGYVIENKYTFRRWLPWREQELLILKKVG